MKEVYDFLKEAQTYYLATVEDGQPRVRPFGTIEIFEGRLYIQTGRSKAVSRQIKENPKVELCAMKGGEWIRVQAVAVDDDRLEPKEHMMNHYPDLRSMYDPKDSNTQVLYLKDAVATIYSFTGEAREIKF